MILPLTKSAGMLGTVANKAIGVMSHPVAGAVATGSIVVPAIAAENRRLKEERAQPPEMPKIGHLLPDTKLGWGFLAPMAARVGAFLAKPAVQAAGNALTIAPAAMSMMGGKAKPAQPSQPANPSTGTPPSSAFTQPMTVTASVITTETGSTDMSQPVMQAAPVPSTRGNPSMTASRDGSSQGVEPTTSAGTMKQKSPTQSAGAPKAFKVGGWLASPRIDTFLNRGSQAAVIGTAAIPIMQAVAESRRNRRDDQAQYAAGVDLRALQSGQQRQADVPDLARKVASTLPLQPKRSIMKRLGDGVKDFGEGAFNAADDQAAKMIAPTHHLDPSINRLPALSHII